VVTIRRVESLAAAAGYDAWLARDSRAMIYATPGFQAFLSEAAGGSIAHLLAEDEGELVGALSYGLARRDGLGALVNSLPWYGSHGGCVGVRDASVRRALLERFRDEALPSDVLSATLVLTPDETRFIGEYEAVLEPRAADDRIGQVTPLPEAGADLEARLEARLAKKTRNLVRKSLHQGFVEEVADSDATWRFLHATHAENLAAIGGRAKPWPHFESLRRHIPAEQRRLSVALLDGEPVAALLLLAFHQTVEYLTPAIVNLFRPRQPLSFLIWHGLRWAAARGCRRWNWGGTWRSQGSLHHFKAGWGAEDHPYSYVVCATEPGLRRIREQREAVSAAFPYYYAYPHHLLDAAPCGPEREGPR
jgi:hypothetical protein